MSRSVLRQWSGGREPSPEQAAMVARHVWERRLFAAGFAGIALVAFHLLWSRGWPDTLWTLWFVLPGSLVAGLLVAEWPAELRRPRGGTRYATLHRRHWRDLVPTYAVVLHTTLTVLAIAAGVLAVATRHWAAGRATTPTGQEYTRAHLYRDLAAIPAAAGWLVAAAALGAAAAVYATAWCAAARPAAADPRYAGEHDVDTAGTAPWVDAALRLRSARVAVGAGTALAGLLMGFGLSLVPLQAFTYTPGIPSYLDPLAKVGLSAAFGMVPLSLVAWSWIASPPRWRARTTA